MSKQLNLTTILAVILLISSGQCKQKKTKRTSALNLSPNDVLERNEVILKFPMYSLKMPPIITARRRSSTKVDPVPVSCTSANVNQALTDLRKKVKCIPRDTVVAISGPEGSQVIPNTVVVQRCGGICSGGQKCISSQVKNVEFYVTSQQFKMTSCNKITVSEDTACTCGCVADKKCLDVQKFDSKLCKCICKNKEEKMECASKSDLNFKWDAKTCSCVCKHEKLCTTGTFWSHEKCRCVRKR